MFKFSKIPLALTVVPPAMSRVHVFVVILTVNDYYIPLEHSTVGLYNRYLFCVREVFTISLCTLEAIVSVQRMNILIAIFLLPERINTHIEEDNLAVCII